jgi:hypothetical protein
MYRESVGVKPVNELAALIAQVALYLEIRIEIKGEVRFVLEPPAELEPHGFIGEIGKMCPIIRATANPRSGFFPS